MPQVQAVGHHADRSEHPKLERAGCAAGCERQNARAYEQRRCGCSHGLHPMGPPSEGERQDHPDRERRADPGSRAGQSAAQPRRPAPLPGESQEGERHARDEVVERRRQGEPADPLCAIGSVEVQRVSDCERDERDPEQQRSGATQAAAAESRQPPGNQRQEHVEVHLDDHGPHDRVDLGDRVRRKVFRHRHEQQPLTDGGAVFLDDENDRHDDHIDRDDSQRTVARVVPESDVPTVTERALGERPVQEEPGEREEEKDAAAACVDHSLEWIVEQLGRRHRRVRFRERVPGGQRVPPALGGTRSAPSASRRPG